MADISKITTLDGTTYDIKDTTARDEIAVMTPLSDEDIQEIVASTISSAEGVEF